MNTQELSARLRQLCASPLPTPGAGETASRHMQLFEIGREDLSLARLAEAHYDAIAILAEAGRKPKSGSIYGVWAAETPNAPVRAEGEAGSSHLVINGTKPFCSGAAIVDRALITVSAPNPWLIDVDLRSAPDQVEMVASAWKSQAFASTNTATVTFRSLQVPRIDIVGERGWYLTRTGFWQGACGPGSCWAGGAAGLLDYARAQSRSDPHTLAHRGAMESAVWTMRAALEAAGRQIDASPNDPQAAHRLALSMRHTVAERCSELLDHFGRAYGPYPLAFCEATARRYQEVTLYIRQCHAERDLEVLAGL